MGKNYNPNMDFSLRLRRALKVKLLLGGGPDLRITALCPYTPVRPVWTLTRQTRQPVLRHCYCPCVSRVFPGYYPGSTRCLYRYLTVNHLCTAWWSLDRPVGVARLAWPGHSHSFRELSTTRKAHPRMTAVLRARPRSVCFDPTAVTDGTRARRRSGAAPGAVIESCGEFESEVEFVDGDEGSESFACWSSGEGAGGWS